MTDLAQIKANFDKDIEDHIMRIMLDAAEYRMIECKKLGNSVHSFTITTTPYYLMITGDMGSFVFNRCTARDMLEFFRFTNKQNGMQYEYWAGKLEIGNYKEFDSHTAVAEAMEFLKQEEQINFKDCDYSSFEEIKELLEGASEDGEHEYFTVLSDLFDELGIEDWYEQCQRVYKPTYHYIWCCHAILWAIAQYDSTVNHEPANEKV